MDAHGAPVESCTVTTDLSSSFKAYDVRGIVGESITAESVRATGAAFVDVLGPVSYTHLDVYKRQSSERTAV